MVNPPAPPLKERARELVSDFQGAIQWTEQQPSTHEARDGYSWYACARSDLLNFIDKQIDALTREREIAQANEHLRATTHAKLSAANARVAELERDSKRLDWLESQFRDDVLQFHLYGEKPYPYSLREAADAVLPAPTEEPGK